MYSDKIKLIDIIFKNIEGGFSGSSPINYIMNIYGIDFLTASAICRIPGNVIKELLGHFTSEESLKELLESKNIPQAAIEYILGRHKAKPSHEYTVTIDHNHERLLTSEGFGNHHEQFWRQYTSIYTIKKIQ